MKKIIYYEDDNLCFSYQEFNEHLFLHCTVYEWKLSSFKKMLKVFASFLEEFKNKTIMAIASDIRFSELFGGKFISEIDVDGRERVVMLWAIQ